MMKTPKLFSSLSKSTIITVVACACFLAMVGMILLFLMMFPVSLDRYMAETPVETTQAPTETAAPETTQPAEDSESESQLSTWEAVIDGETKPINEHFGDSRPEYNDPGHDDPPEYHPNDPTEVPTQDGSTGETNPPDTSGATDATNNEPTNPVNPTGQEPTTPLIPDPTEPPAPPPTAAPTDPPYVPPFVETMPPAAPEPANFDLQG